MTQIASTARLSYYRTELLIAHEGLLQSAAAAYLTGTNIKMNGCLLNPQDEILVEADPEFNLKVRDLAQLFGVFNGSRLALANDPQTNYSDAPPGLYATVANSGLIQHPQKNKCGLIRSAGGNIGLSFAGLFMDNYMLRSDAPALLGTVAFGLCAMRAFLLGLENISLVAAGGVGFHQGYFGYHVWPKLGFDAQIFPGEFHAGNAPELANCTTVQEAISTNETSWQTYGSQRLMYFDLDPDSVSWSRLLKYLHAKGIWSPP